MAPRQPLVTIEPLDAAELEELQGVLDEGDGMASVPEVFGAFAALATAPQLVSPNDWLQLVLGDAHFEDMEHAQRVFDLLVRSYNVIVDELAQGHRVVPGPEVDEEVLAAWCYGYLDIAEADEEWRADENARALLMPFAILCGEFDLIGETDDQGNVIEDDTPQRQRARAALHEITMDLYAYWASRRGAPPVKKKPGRNEMCPCGSGKKYKRCCGTVH